MSPDNLLGYGIPDLNLALTLNLEDFSKENFRIYPNPAHDNLFLSFPKNLDQSRLKVYDVLGKLLINKKVNRISNKINLKSLNRGIYVIKINAENVSQSFKLIKR